MTVGPNLQPRHRVAILGHIGLVQGTIVEHVPERGGYLVQPDSQAFTGGFGYDELDDLCQLCDRNYDEPLPSPCYICKLSQALPRPWWERLEWLPFVEPRPWWDRL